MKTRFLLLVFLLATHALAAGVKRKVLFLGNSYTHYNNLPTMLSLAAASVGDTLVFDMYAPGGYTLAQHYSDSAGVDKIKAGGWDFVVLQEQSQKPSFPSYSLADAMQLSRQIRKYNPCARPLFYRTWGRKNGDLSNCGVWPPVCTYAGMDSLLHLRYLQMAQVNHTEVSPVGSVWKYIRQQFPTIDLYIADESHPSVAGSYAAACSFYASVFKKNPAAITYNGGLNAATAVNIRLAAKSIVFDSLASWYFPDPLPQCRFNYVAGTGLNEIRFINKSQYGDTYHWDFGDGNTSALSQPTHTYSANGSYTVTLTVSRCDLGTVYQSSFQKTVRFCAFTPVVSPDTIMLCTVNPDTLWTQAFDSYQWFTSDGDSIPDATNRYYVPTTSDNHYVIASQNGCSEMSSPAFVDARASFDFYYVQPQSSLPICEGDTVLLVLQPVTSPQPQDSAVQWFRNGTPVPLSANDTLEITTSGSYHAVVYDTEYCPGSPIFVTSALPIEFQNCTVAASKEETTAPVFIYPNPGKDFTIQIPNYLVGVSFSVTDVVGRIVLTGTFHKETNPLQLTGAKSGVYLLRIQDNKVQPFRLLRE